MSGIMAAVMVLPFGKEPKMALQYGTVLLAGLGRLATTMKLTILVLGLINLTNHPQVLLVPVLMGMAVVPVAAMLVRTIQCDVQVRVLAVTTM